MTLFLGIIIGLLGFLGGMTYISWVIIDSGSYNIVMRNLIKKNKKNLKD